MYWTVRLLAFYVFLHGLLSLHEPTQPRFKLVVCSIKDAANDINAYLEEYKQLQIEQADHAHDLYLHNRIVRVQEALAFYETELADLLKLLRAE